MHGPERPGSTGFTIFFPNSVLFETTMGEDAQPAYVDTASRFAAASLWDDFLRFHYTGEEFSPDDADLAVLEPDGSSAEAPDDLPSEPAVVAAVEAPGAGEAIRIAPLEASADTVDVTDTVTLTTEITGGNVAYLYLYVSYYDEQSESFLTADWDFIGADDTLEVDGVFYPDWGPSGVGELEVDWEPTVYFLSDGEQEEFAEFRAQTYGATTEQNEYQVRGFITFADTGNQRDAGDDLHRRWPAAGHLGVRERGRHRRAARGDAARRRPVHDHRGVARLRPGSGRRVRGLRGRHPARTPAARSRWSRSRPMPGATRSASWSRTSTATRSPSTSK